MRDAVPSRLSPLVGFIYRGTLNIPAESRNFQRNRRVDLFPVTAEIVAQQRRLALDQKNALDHTALLLAVEDYVIGCGQDVDSSMVDKYSFVLDRQFMGKMAPLFEHPFKVVVPGFRHAVERRITAGHGHSMSLDIAAQIQNWRRAGFDMAPAPVGIELFQCHVRLLAQKIMVMNHRSVLSVSFKARRQPDRRLILYQGLTFNAVGARPRVALNGTLISGGVRAFLVAAALSW